MTKALLSAHTRTFASLRMHRNYRLFFGGQVVSVSGTWMQNIATAWLVLDLTHSPVAVGVLAAFQFLPYTVFGLFAGVIVDRLDVRRTIIGTQTASMIFAFALAGLTLAGVVNLWEVYLLTGLRGTVLVLDAPARQALTYQMVGRDELPNAVALNSSLFNAARVVGPAVGGLVVAAAGPGTCFAINGVTFLAVLAGLLMMRVSEFFPVAAGQRPASLLGGTADALRYVRRTPMAATALVAVLLLSTFSFNFNVLLPVLARTTLHSGPNVLGAITAAFGAGALLGALAAASMGRASLRWMLVGMGGFGVAQLVLGPQGSLAAACALLFVTGLSFTLWTSAANSVLQLGAPDHLRGRVAGLYYFAFNGTGPAAGVLAGWLAATGGTELAFFVSGAIAALTAGWVAVRLVHDGRIESLPAALRLGGVGARGR
ncbi:MAG TPA: MFS transporter [Gaiellales bacterium]